MQVAKSKPFNNFWDRCQIGYWLKVLDITRTRLNHIQTCQCNLLDRLNCYLILSSSVIHFRFMDEGKQAADYHQKFLTEIFQKMLALSVGDVFIRTDRISFFTSANVTDYRHVYMVCAQAGRLTTKLNLDAWRRPWWFPGCAVNFVIEVLIQVVGKHIRAHAFIPELIRGCKKIVGTLSSREC